MIFLLTTFTLLAIACALTFTYFNAKYKFFTSRNVVGPKPEFFFGNMREAFFKRRHFSSIIDDFYQMYKHTEQIIGFYNITTPYYLLISPDLIKQILVKDFKHFRNNEFSGLSDKKKDPVMALNPFVMRDEEWKEKRTEVASGMTQNKLKSMFPLVQDVGKRFAEYIKLELNRNQLKSFDSREISVRYTCDTVSSCIFGIDGGSFTKKESEIISMGNKMIRSISDAAKSFLPKRLMPQDVQDFFVYLMEEAIKYRNNHSISRDDFLAHIISLKKKKDMSEIEMVAHGVTFFLDGFDTSSIGLAPIFYELGKNKRVQNKLREELVTAFPNENDVTYDKLLDNQYLENVIYESLRISPPITFANRECSENITLELNNKKKITIEKGEKVIIPLISIQQDPEYYHDPKEFIPERYDHGIKEYRDKGLLFPFGEGPRECLGKRFALLQVKTAIYYIVRNFEISVNEELTAKNLEIDPEELLMNVKKGGMWLNFKEIEC
uniref:Cytochrome P450 6FW1 n=1 Tax=Chironomus kiiensis TaxID=84408 RepID=W6E8V5_CHIKI|nr:cytochrome P450 6FW1 [Chironomus kiiensis]